jgi:hypothetical protein
MKKKVVIVIIIGVILIMSIFFISQIIFWSRPVAPKRARVVSDLHQIMFAMESYYKDNGVYLSSNERPKNIGNYLKFPEDIPPFTYHWINNTKNNQKYCVWVKDMWGKGYFIITQLGFKEDPNLTTDPATLADCENRF